LHVTFALAAARSRAACGLFVAQSPFLRAKCLRCQSSREGSDTKTGL